LATQHELWVYRDTTSGWKKVNAPSGSQIHQVVAISSAEAWVTGLSQAQGVLWQVNTTSGTNRAVLLPSDSVMRTARQSSHRVMATKTCQDIYVHLLTLGTSKQGTPATYSTLKDVLVGQPWLERVAFITEDDGAYSYLGARVSSFDDGERLVALYKEKG